MSDIRGSVLVARFGGYKTITTSSLWQYDYGQTLKFEGLTLPEAYEVHFSKSDSVGTAITQIGNAEGVTIPDMMLLKPGPIYVWIYLHEGSDDGETEYKITIPVKERAKPTNDTPTPVQQDSITQAIAALNVAVEETAADALMAEGYALGSQNGEPVSSESPYFEANAKWFKEKAEDARDTSVSAKDASESARDSSISAKDASVLAANRSEAARDASIAAKNDSISARDASIAAKLESVAARDAAEGFQNGALSAKADAINAKNDAISAKNASVSAKNDAIAAKNEAVTAKNASVSAKNDAVAAKEAAIDAKDNAISAKEAAEGARDEVLGFNVMIETLPAGSSATASYDSGIMSLGIPRGDKGAKGDTGATGQTGATGPKGDKGEGVVAGGSPGQILKKKSGTDYDTEWADMIHPVQFHICTAGEYMASTKIPYIQNPDPTTFYLVPDGTGNDVFLEWINLGGTWEKLGSTRIDLTNYVQKTDIATASVPGLVKPNASYGTRMGDGSFQNTIMVAKADDSEVKSGSGSFKPIVPANEHAATFFGLAKAAGDTSQAESDNPIGTYTDGAKTAIRGMLGVGATGVGDVQIDGTSVVSEGVANIPVSSRDDVGVHAIGYGFKIDPSTNRLILTSADIGDTRLGSGTTYAITPFVEHAATFFGLAKAAGDTTQADAGNASLGTYTDTAKGKILSMLGTEGFLAPIEVGTTSTRDYSTGDVFVLGSSLQRATAAILTGESFTSANHEAITIGEDFVKKTDYASNTDYGVVRYSNNGYNGIIDMNGIISTNPAYDTDMKNGTVGYKPICPNRQHIATFYGLAKAAGDTTQSQSNNAVGTYTDAAKTAIQGMLGITDLIPDFQIGTVTTGAAGSSASASITGTTTEPTLNLTIPKGSSGVHVGTTAPTDPDVNVWVDPSGSAFDVQINGTSIINNGVANVPIGSDSVLGVAKFATQNGIAINNGYAVIAGAGTSTIKSAESYYKPVVPATQHISTFYGLAKAAGDSTQAQSENEIGTYTSEAKTAIKSMLGVSVDDVQINGTSILSNGVANIPKAGDNSSVLGVVATSSSFGIRVNDAGKLYTYTPSNAEMKEGLQAYKPIVPVNQHTATFYGLAKAAGDTTMSSSSNAVGTYTSEAKVAIKNMLGVTDSALDITVSGTTPDITAQANARYVCGEVSMITFTPPASGICEVIFESGATPAVLTLPNTVKMPEWFDDENLEAHTIYNISIVDGVYGAVMTWAS